MRPRVPHWEQMPLSWPVYTRKAWFRYLTENAQAAKDYDMRIAAMDAYANSKQGKARRDRA